MIARGQGKVDHPKQKTFGEALGSMSGIISINRLLEIGALKTKYQELTPELMRGKENIDDPALLLKYELTPLGNAILSYAIEKQGIMQPSMYKYIQEIAAKNIEIQKESQNHT